MNASYVIKPDECVKESQQIILACSGMVMVVSYCGRVNKPENTWLGAGL